MLIFKKNFNYLFLNFFFFYFNFFKFCRVLFNFFYFFNFKNVLNDLIFLKKKMVFLKKSRFVNQQLFSKIVKKTKVKKNIKKILFNQSSNFSKNYFFFKFFYGKTSKKTIDLKKKFFDMNLKSRRDIILFLQYKDRNKFFKKKLKNFLKSNKNYKLFFFDFFVWYALIKNNIIFTSSDSFFLLKNNFIFLNGKNIKNADYFLKVGDCVQVVIHTKILIFLKTFGEFLKKSLIKIKKKVWLFHKQRNITKQNNLKITPSLNNLFFFKQRLSFFYEIDFFSFSFFLIYKPFFFFESSNFFLKFINFFMFRLYNWKLLS